MQKTENYIIHLLFIGMIGMADAAIYLLLELLLDGNSTYYAQGSGSFPNEKLKFQEKLVFSGLYFWHAINLIAVSILVYRIVVEGRKKTIKFKKHSR